MTTFVNLPPLGTSGGGGDATAANQVTGNAYLSSMNAKLQGGLLAGILFDKIVATYPTSLTELYVYSLLGVTQAQIRLTYTTTSKNDLSIAERV